MVNCRSRTSRAGFGCRRRGLHVALGLLAYLEHAPEDVRVTESATLLLVTGPPGTGKSTLAEHAAGALGASVLGWDWVMAGLKPYEKVQDALGRLSHIEYRGVGWSIMLSLATSQLRRGRSVVLDGVARAVEVDAVRATASAMPGVRLVLVVTSCSDAAAHRARIEGRRRDIPGWHELEWADVEKVLAGWQPPEGADLHLDATSPLASNRDRLVEVLAHR
jgi:predicted kinase